MAHLTPPSLSADAAKAYDRLANRGVAMPPGDVVPDPDEMNGLVGQLFHHPALARNVGALVVDLAKNGVLPKPLRELAILRTAATLRAGYVWVTHLGAARRAGLRDDQLAALLRGFEGHTGGPEFDALQRAVLALVDATLAARSVPPAAQAAVLAAVQPVGLIEMIVLCGTYRMIAGFVAALDIPLPAGVPDPFPA